MLYKSFALLAIAVASISALPHEITKRDDFIHDQNGNLKLTFELGDIAIDKIIDELAKACSTQGQCDTSSIEIKGSWIPQGWGDTVGETLTVNPSGSYPTWIHNGLIDALHAAVKEIATCKDVTHQSPCPNPMAYCPSQKITTRVCSVPQYWGINYQPSDLNGAPPFIGADMDVKIDDDGFCKTFTTIGSGVAGAVHGIGGGIFTLLSLACK